MHNGITKDNQAFIIREPEAHDAEKVLHFARMIFAATDQVLTTPLSWPGIVPVGYFLR